MLLARQGIISPGKRTSTWQVPQIFDTPCTGQGPIVVHFQKLFIRKMSTQKNMVLFGHVQSPTLKSSLESVENARVRASSLFDLAFMSSFYPSQVRASVRAANLTQFPGSDCQDNGVHARGGEMNVATIPATRYSADPLPNDLPRLDEILSLVDELPCSMYDNALIPVALANKLVSLSDFPSQRILTSFVRQQIKH